MVNLPKILRWPLVKIHLRTRPKIRELRANLDARRFSTGGQSLEFAAALKKALGEIPVVPAMRYGRPRSQRVGELEGA